eukprot:2959027-Pyramimonas_sp.AAC.1
MFQPSMKYVRPEEGSRHGLGVNVPVADSAGYVGEPSQRPHSEISLDISFDGEPRPGTPTVKGDAELNWHAGGEEDLDCSDR